MSAITIELRARMAWWWTYLYYPLCMLASAMDLPLDLDLIEEDAERALIVESRTSGGRWTRCEVEH